ncbi:MAG: SCO family protein [Planctomycetota bacterium]
MTDEHPPQPALPIRTVAVFAMIAAVLAVASFLMRGQPSSSRATDKDESRFADFLIPEFQLTSQRGETIDQTILDGEDTIVAFVFTHCPFICPGMFTQMKNIQEATADTSLRFLAISVDPTHDTPERLREYAELRGLDTQRFTLATGPVAEVNRILAGVGLAIQVDDSVQITLPDGSTMQNIAHPGRLIWIGADRRPRRMPSFDDEAAIQSLIAQARSDLG